MDKPTTELMFSSKSDEWSTPDDFFKKLDDKYHFTLDPCATEENKKCDKFFTIDQDGLLQSWEGEVVFVNPPYSKIKDWVKKCYDSFIGGGTTVVLLIPARTDTRYFHDYIYKKEGIEIDFIKGRLKFGGNKNAAPFPSMVVIFKK